MYVFSLRILSTCDPKGLHTTCGFMCMRMHLPQLIYDSKGLWENNEHTKPRVNRRKDAISYLMGLCDSSVQ